MHIVLLCLEGLHHSGAWGSCLGEFCPR